MGLQLYKIILQKAWSPTSTVFGQFSCSQQLFLKFNKFNECSACHATFTLAFFLAQRFNKKNCSIYDQQTIQIMAEDGKIMLTTVIQKLEKRDGPSQEGITSETLEHKMSEM